MGGSSPATMGDNVDAIDGDDDVIAECHTTGHGFSSEITQLYIKPGFITESNRVAGSNCDLEKISAFPLEIAILKILRYYN
jgi:hypothetical protein